MLDQVARLPCGDSPLPRRITIGTAAAVVIANTIGSGIFTTSGFIARDVGSPVWLMALWAAGGLIALAGALSYAELGAAMPEAGGEYVYLRRAYGPFVAYLSGWTSFFVGFSGAIAASALAFVGYVHHFVAVLDPSTGVGRAAALVIVGALSAAHVAGVGPGGMVQRVLTTATVGAIAALVLAGIAFGHGSIGNFSATAPAYGSAAVSFIFVLYAYSGWNAAAYLAGELREPERTLPRALLLGTATVIGLYLALNALYLYALPIDAMSGVLAIGDKASVALFGAAGSNLVAAILALTILGSASAMVLAGPRVYYAMARDGLFPRRIATISTRFGTPASAIALQGAWSGALIVSFGTFERLVVYTGFVVTIFAALAVAGVIALRVREPDLPRPFRVPGYPWIPGLYVAVSAWIVAYAIAERPTEALLGLLTVAAGLPFYFLRRWAPSASQGSVRD